MSFGVISASTRARYALQGGCAHVGESPLKAIRQSRQAWKLVAVQVGGIVCARLPRQHHP